MVKDNFKGMLNPKHWDSRNVSMFTKMRPLQDTSRVHILQYELNWNFRFGVNTCVEKMVELGVDLKKFIAGNCFAFVNAKKNRVRLLTIDEKGWPASIVQAAPDGEHFDVRALKFLPKAFNGPSLDMDMATSKFLDVFFTSKREQRKLLGPPK